MEKEGEQFQEIGAWLLCHKQECASLSHPELGQMAGYTGFVSAQLVAAMATFFAAPSVGIVADTNEEEERLLDVVLLAIQRSLVPHLANSVSSNCESCWFSWSLQFDAAVSWDEGCSFVFFERLAGVGPVEGVGHRSVVVVDEVSELIVEF